MAGFSQPGVVPAAASTIASAAVSVADAVPYGLTMGHRRELLTDDPAREYMMGQVGRLLFRDDFENGAIKWGLTGTPGAVALDAASSALKGAQSMKITTPAGPAGTQTFAQKFVMMPGDQGFQAGSANSAVGVRDFNCLIVVEFYFRPNDANWRDFQLLVRPDDTVQRYEAILRFQQRNAGVAVGQFMYWDANATAWPVLATWPIPDGNGDPSNAWHHVMVGLAYRQGGLGAGGGGYLQYAIAKFDDFTAIGPQNFSIGPSGGPNARPLATGGLRQCQVAIALSCDAAVATSVNVDEFQMCDLAGLFQL